MSDLDEILEIVDENNQLVGQATRGECYKKGYLHRAVNIFIFNSKGEVFLHKRSAKKLKYPLFWDLSCSEHVKVNESFDKAAKRGLKEELGVEIPLEVCIPIHRFDSMDESGESYDNELSVTYKGVFDGEMEFDPGEVSEGKFFNIEGLNKILKKGEIKVTPWFLEDWKLLNLNLNK